MARSVYTIFSFLTQGTNFKESNAYAECFDANFKQEDSCARCLAKVLAFQENGQIGSKNDSWEVWPGASFKQKHSCARFFSQVLSKKANESFLDIIDHTNHLRQIYSCPPFFYTSFRSHCKNICQRVVFFTFLREDAFFLKFEVAHTDLTSQFRHIFSCALRFAQIFGCLTPGVNFKETDSCAECLNANFEQQHICARCFARA